MKHIKETSAPLPADLPPNVRELIEITLVKNPGMRYRNGGQFADAVAAVRAVGAGRHGRTPHPTIKASPAAIPGQRAAVEAARAANTTRPRVPVTCGAPVPARHLLLRSARTAVAAGVLGARRSSPARS